MPRRFPWRDVDPWEFYGVRRIFGVERVGCLDTIDLVPPRWQRLPFLVQSATFGWRALVRAVVEAVRIPVTVKMRLGWDDNQHSAPFFAQQFEDAGIAAVTIHGRTRAQGCGGSVNLDGIRAVVEAVRDIRVIGNGDVRTIADAVHMMKYTGCSGIAIGRGALLNPWFFAQLQSWIETGEIGLKPTRRQRVASVGLVDADGSRFLIDATPDIASQIESLWGNDSPPDRQRPVEGILLTHAHVGHYAGLMYLGREALGARRIPVYATPRMASVATFVRTSSSVAPMWKPPSTAWMSATWCAASAASSRPPP